MADPSTAETIKVKISGALVRIGDGASASSVAAVMHAPPCCATTVVRSRARRVVQPNHTEAALIAAVAQP